MHIDVPLIDPAYWLDHCHGFLVDSPGGSVGVVDDVITAGDSDRAEGLVIATGWFGRRRITIGVNDVREIDPRGRRLAISQSLEKVPKRGDSGSTGSCNPASNC